MEVRAGLSLQNCLERLRRQGRPLAMPIEEPLLAVSHVQRRQGLVK
jgi:hypothetical protein